jgi:hypothetical protein
MGQRRHTIGWNPILEQCSGLDSIGHEFSQSIGPCGWVGSKAGARFTGNVKNRISAGTRALVDAAQIASSRLARNFPARRSVVESSSTTGVAVYTTCIGDFRIRAFFLIIRLLNYVASHRC